MSRSRIAVHLGYATTQKGYLLYDLTSKTFFVNRDVVFKEDIFPFKLQEQQHTPIFRFTDLNDPQPIHTIDQIQVLRSADVISEEPVSSTQVREQVQANVPVVSQEENRKSTRGKRPPLWMKDSFISVCSTNTILLRQISII